LIQFATECNNVERRYQAVELCAQPSINKNKLLHLKFNYDTHKRMFNRKWLTDSPRNSSNTFDAATLRQSIIATLLSNCSCPFTSSKFFSNLVNCCSESRFQAMCIVNHHNTDFFRIKKNHKILLTCSVKIHE